MTNKMLNNYYKKLNTTCHNIFKPMQQIMSF